MYASWTAGILVGLSLFLPFTKASVEQFDEKLTIQPLRDGKVVSTFSFKTLLKGASPRDPRTLGTEDVSQHYSVFPLALGQILREYAVTELHLTLNAGRWNYDRWGYPNEPGVGTGAELWAWMGDGGRVSVDHRWKGLRNALSGLFCASLASLDEQRTTSPDRSFDPEGMLPDWGVPHRIRHATLPSENVCTENLTPFLKLLPCKSLSGIASLLNPHRLFDADWHGMGIHVLWREDEGVEVRLTFQSVSDPVRSSLGRKRDWSLRSLFDRTIDRQCPIARSSEIIVALPQEGTYSIYPEPSLVNSGKATFDVATVEKPLDVAIQWPIDFQYPYGFDTPITALSVQRTLRGSSQAHGQLSVIVKNHQNSTQQVMYLETMPWLVQFYLHTLEIHVNDIRKDNALFDVTYIPAVPHSRPATLQGVLEIPPNSVLHLKMDVTKSFLRYTEHPPDSKRGWDLPPAMLTILDSGANGTTIQRPHSRIYTSTLLVDMATPDFSMPYNVIIFTCSLIAFIFGSVFNLLTRKFVVVRID